MKTFETEKGSIPDGATHYFKETENEKFAWWNESKALLLCPDNIGQWESPHGTDDISSPIPIPQTNTETPEDKTPELTRDSSPQGVISSISNRLHNMSCEHQDSELGEELGSMACDMWGVLPMISNESIEEEKPRTKVEYEKCSFECAWHAVKAFEDGEKLYTKRSHKDYILIDNAPDVLRFLYDLHERIETPMTERELFVEAAGDALPSFDKRTAPLWAGKLYDSGKFKLIK